MMIKLGAPLQNKQPTLGTLATLYPAAFAMATTSNSRSSLALQRWGAVLASLPDIDSESTSTTALLVKSGN
jgi:hypothetical protein